MRHYNGTLGLDVVAICQPTKLLLVRRVPHVLLDGPSVGVEHQGVDLHAQGGYILLKFTHQMTFNECSFSSASQYK